MTVDDHAGFLVPAWYVREEIGEFDSTVCSFLLGFTISAAVFTAARAGNQTVSSWRRTRRITLYVFLVWMEWLSSVIIAVVAWTFQRAYIPASLWLYLAIALLWSIQVQLLLQIIANRLSLLSISREHAKRLKWSVGLGIAFVNISVFIIWTPARLQISPTWIAINLIWDRIEKAIFAIFDIGLNLKFVYLIRSQLINNGLKKYTRLYQVNLIMICISLSLDVILIGTMSMKSSLVYLQFHPVVYLLKLAIEMAMADLIVKVVKATNPSTHVDGSYFKEAFTFGTTTAGGNSFSYVLSNTLTAVTKNGGSRRCSAAEVYRDTELGVVQKPTDIHMMVRDRPIDGTGFDEASRRGSVPEMEISFK